MDTNEARSIMARYGGLWAMLAYWFVSGFRPGHNWTHGRKPALCPCVRLRPDSDLDTKGHANSGPYSPCPAGMRRPAFASMIPAGTQGKKT